MVAVALLAVNLMEQIGGAVDDKVLIGEVRRGIDTAEYLDNLQSVDGSVCVVDGVQNFRRTISGRCVAGLNGQVGAEHAGGGAGVAAGDEQVTAADAEIQIARLELRKFHAQILRFFLRSHAVRVPRSGLRCNDEFVPSLSSRLQFFEIRQIVVLQDTGVDGVEVAVGSAIGHQRFPRGKAAVQD